MDLFKKVNGLGKKMTVCDFSYLKLSVMFATLFKESKIPKPL